MKLRDVSSLAQGYYGRFEGLSLSSISTSRCASLPVAACIESPQQRIIVVSVVF